MILKRASKKANKYAIMNFHYSKRLPSIIMSYSVFNNNNEWCGVICYGMGANAQIGNPYNLVQGQILELVRVALNGKQESTSKALAISLRLIKKDCPTLKMIVSYADKGQNHKGIIYQATNWIFVDESKSSSIEYFFNNKWLHSKTVQDYCHKNGLKVSSLKKRKSSGKYKYLYPLNKEMRKKIEKISKSYPKELGIDSVKVTHNITNIEKAGQYRPQCSN